MKPAARQSLVLAATLLAVALIAQGCSAVPQILPENDGLPRGSYRESCKDPRMPDDRRLVAECRNEAGEYFRTTVTLPCWGKIVNRDGWLVCDDDDGRITVPDGPYRTQCRNEHVVDDTLLVAECRDNRNRWTATKLAVPCGDAIRVENGRLVCGFIGAPRGFTVPRGSYRDSCTEPRIAQDDMLIANCPDAEGHVFETRLRLPCDGDVANDGGELVCRN